LNSLILYGCSAIIFTSRGYGTPGPSTVVH
jgi:hypothetical protein